MLHHNFPKGTHIFIILKDGQKFDAKFLDRKARMMITSKGEIPFRDIQATMIFKHGALGKNG